MSFLPEEIVSDILCRLPVKPLVRFRCVSKSWRALIDSSNFIKSHLKRSTETRTNRTFILGGHLRYDCVFGFPSTLHAVDECSLEAVKLDYHPLNPRKVGYLGSCDGLLLLYSVADDGGKQITLWNPFTRKHQILPSPDFEFGIQCSKTIHGYGFGYDSVSDDYKVVRTLDWEPGQPKKSQVLIYSLKSNQWRKIPDFHQHYYHPYLDYRNKTGDSYAVFVAGALHQIVYQKHDDSYLVAAFDLASEEHRLLALPDRGGGDDDCVFMILGVLEGCLYIQYCNNYVTYYVQEGRVGVEGRVEVWVMKEYGVGESWTKLYEVPHVRMTPLAYSKSGDGVIAMNPCKLYLLDLDHSSVKELDVRGVDHYVYIGTQVCCVQSLVPLRDSDRYVSKKQHTDEKKKNFKQTSSRKGSTPGAERVVAQIVERLKPPHEVLGSNPVDDKAISLKKKSTPGQCSGSKSRRPNPPWKY